MRKSIVISAPSGSGKTSIVNFLLADFDELEFSVSACNRKKRQNEVNGKNYHFLKTSDFKNKISQGAFLEWEEVYLNKFYGTLISEVDRIWQSGKCAVFDIDVKGALSIKERYKDSCLAIFIAPPSLKILQQRLIKRGTDSVKNIDIRLAKTDKELTYQKDFDCVVINDDFALACQEVKKLVIEFLKK